MNAIKRLLNSYLNTGLNTQRNPENNRKIYLINLVGLIGVFLTAMLGTSAMFHANYSQAATLYTICSIYLASYFAQRKTGSKPIYASIILYSMFGFLIFMVYSGGVANTGPLWIFVAAPVALFFDGLKKGLINIAAFTAAVTLLLYYPDNQLLATQYSDEFKERLLFSFLTVTLLSAYYEFSRQRSFDFIVNISRKFEQLAKYDPLTRLPNRRDAEDKLEYEHRRIERNLTPVAVILCDVDFFKNVNDSFGHAVGDQVLVELANLFRTIIRKQDTVARWGGEEFLFILPQTNANQAIIVAKKIQKHLTLSEFECEQKKVKITVSMGISEVNAKTDIPTALKQADEFLYLAKDNGRDQFQPQSVVYKGVPEQITETEAKSRSEETHLA